MLPTPCPEEERGRLDVGFVSLTEALDLTTPAGRAMAGLLAAYAEFEREILTDSQWCASRQAPVPSQMLPDIIASTWRVAWGYEACFKKPCIGGLSKVLIPRIV